MMPEAAPDGKSPDGAPKLGDNPLRRVSDLPGPRGLPFVANTLQMDKQRFHQQLEGWCDVFGPIYKMRFGSRQAFVVSDHQVVVRMLRDRPEGFRRTVRLETISTEIGFEPGVFVAHGEMWRRHRRLVMTAFQPDRVKRYFESLATVGENLIRRWDKAASAASVIDLQADLMRYTVDAVAALAFGETVNTLGAKADVIQQHLDEIFPAMYRRIFAPIPTWRFSQTEADRRLTRSVKAVNEAIAEFVRRARARLEAEPARRANPENLLEAMVVADDEPSSGFDDKQVTGNVVTMLLAGEDNTANTIAWLTYLLWSNPAALQRATAEVHQVCAGNRVPTLENIEKLEYVEAAAHEAMRLKPAGPHLPLEALLDTTVGDVHVPAGTVVICVLRHASVSEAHVPRAAEFRAGTLAPVTSGGRSRIPRSSCLFRLARARASVLGASWRFRNQDGNCCAADAFRARLRPHGDRRPCPRAAHVHDGARRSADAVACDRVGNGERPDRWVRRSFPRRVK